VSRRSAWTIVELLVVLAVVVLLAGLLVPSLGAVRRRARIAACAVGMHEIHQGLMAYAAVNRLRLPPFRFSSFRSPSLPASGHWGGISQPSDPAILLAPQRAPYVSVNLWTLVEQGSVPAARLICPAAPAGLTSGRASYFPHTLKFSTYCLRFPYSPDLFGGSPGLSWRNGDLLGVYRAYSGGDRVLVAPGDAAGVGGYFQTVPLMRIDRSYRIHPAVSNQVPWGDGRYDVSADTMLADTFWWQGRAQPALSGPDGQGCAVAARWCHGGRFNALRGDGAVRAVADEEGRARDNTTPPEGDVPQAGPCDAVAAERVWQFLDTAD